MLSFHIDSGYVVTWLGVFLRVSHMHPWWMETWWMVRGEYSGVKVKVTRMIEATLRIFLGLKFSIPGFFGWENILIFWGCLYLSRNVFGVFQTLKII